MSNLNNVALWFAKDFKGNVITVDKIKNNYNEGYFCPLCGSEVIPKALESTKVSPHFAHLNREACGGESVVHWWVKNELIKKDDVFEIITNESNQLMCKELLLEQSYETPYGTYKPDISIITYKNETVFVEVNFTNKKNIDEYYLKWKYLGNTVVEFSIKNIYSEENNKVITSNSFNAIYYKGMKFNIDKNDKEYTAYRKSIGSKIDTEEYEKLKQIEWFIEDIYRYNKGVIDIKELELGYGEAINLSEEIIEKIYKNNKCSKALKDIVLYRDELVADVKNKISNEFNVDVWCSNNAQERLIVDRLFSPNRIKINTERMLKDIIEQENMSLKMKYLYDIGMKNIYDDMWVEITGLDNIYPYYKSKQYVLKVMDELKNTLYKYEAIYNYVIQNKYLYRDSNYNYSIYTNFKRNILEFVIKRLANLGIINDINEEWKYVNKTIKNIIRDIIESDYSYFESNMEEVCGELFINLESENVERDIECIGNKLLKLREEYDFIFSKCYAVDNVLKINGYKNYSIKVNGSLDEINIYGNNINGKIYKNGVIRINDVNMCKTEVNNLDSFIRDFEISINYTTENGNCLFSQKDMELYSKILDRYTKENNKNYRVVADKMEIVIFANYNQEISRYKYNENTSFEEVIDKFSKDVRKYLYS